MGNITTKAISKDQTSEINDLKSFITSVINDHDPTELIDSIKIEIKLKPTKDLTSHIEFDNVKQYVEQIIEDTKDKK